MQNALYEILKNVTFNLLIVVYHIHKLWIKNIDFEIEVDIFSSKCWCNVNFKGLNSPDFSDFSHTNKYGNCKDLQRNVYLTFKSISKFYHVFRKHSETLVTQIKIQNLSTVQSVSQCKFVYPIKPDLRSQIFLKIYSLSLKQVLM